MAATGATQSQRVLLTVGARCLVRQSVFGLNHVWEVTVSEHMAHSGQRTLPLRCGSVISTQNAQVKVLWSKVPCLLVSKVPTNHSLRGYTNQPIGTPGVFGLIWGRTLGVHMLFILIYMHSSQRLQQQGTF